MFKNLMHNHLRGFDMATIPLTDSGLKKINDCEKSIAGGAEAKTNVADGGGLTLQRQPSGVWAIAPHRMKMKTIHLVPLVRLRAITGGQRYLFPISKAMARQ
jgi:hypothetical protein